MINKKFLLFVCITCIPHCSVMPFPDIFWIGHISKMIWSKIPSLSPWITNKDGQKRFSEFRRKMTQHYETLQTDMDNAHLEEKKHIDNKFEKARQEAAQRFKEQEVKLIHLGKNVDELEDVLQKNNSKIGQVHKIMTSYTKVNECIQTRLNLLDTNIQKTKTLFQKYNAENKKTKLHAIDLRKQCIFWQKECKKLHVLHKILQDKFNIVVEENEKLNNNVFTLIENNNKKQEYIDFLKNFIEQKLPLKTNSLPLKLFVNVEEKLGNVPYRNMIC